MDHNLDQFMEDHINGGYGPILDEITAEKFLEDGPLCCNCDDEGCDYCCESFHDDCPLDGDHDSTMESIGWGTDEDYGCYGGDEEW